ncbi:hypothetical protein [Shewanella woodyi]|uniref:Uncharacterized protein n=1 Tax=Shewanella woodyi (strain ATCC 51908 / MS32) TaxID=392500 RepID=B1KKL2_SHEWM|nr:hypothetical protein [Shewanella woodyi]ACA87229.1 hypothetical protein Swoo_2956 [Shewanella woodyi ATCC 51908]
MTSKEEVIKFLKSCSECELLSVVQALSEEKRYLNRDGSRERVTRRYLLASTCYDIEGEDVVGDPTFSFIGMPQDGENWLSSAADAGICPRCKSEVRGFCTHSICPVCDRNVALT